MRALLLLLLFCHVSSPVKHRLTFISTASSGLPYFSEFVGAIMVDEHLVVHCDDGKKLLEPRHNWVKEVLEKDPFQLRLYRLGCFELEPISFKATIISLKQRSNQNGGVHTLQLISGCEWDDETREVSGFHRYGYDGEDFTTFDLKTETWNTLKPHASIIKPSWDSKGYTMKEYKHYLMKVFPVWLEKYVDNGRSFLQRTELPSVSLLQKTPSSPVSCHATGFYPHRAALFWRKDEEELHEEVDHKEILPNPDGTFQMSVDLNLSSVTPENWTRYDCVFQLHGVKEDIIIKLEKDRIRTNWVEPSDMTVPVTAAVVVLALILIGAVGFIVSKKKKAISPPSPPDNSTELSEQLNPET
ncbi:major histocompatibility complex class I-related gene protein-like [Pagrus major]|uniref:major histocompatibility complex class I-related gene protein-like n=1 Tax=Pagrus major TaxID=143350 RepID=UPI003CC8619B